MSHQIIQDLHNRYTVKKYDETKTVSAEDMDVVLEALRLSPSSINSQPWRFLVIESDEAKQRLHDSYEENFQFNQPHAKEASHTILFAYDPKFTKEKFVERVDVEVSSGHLPEAMRDSFMGAYAFADSNTDETGFNGHWTQSQVYLAMGNVMHAVARLGIDSTPMEGIDSAKLGEIFKEELDGHICVTALALGYHKDGDDWNHGLPKARLAREVVMRVL